MVLAFALLAEPQQKLMWGPATTDQDRFIVSIFVGTERTDIATIKTEMAINPTVVTRYVVRAVAKDGRISEPSNEVMVGPLSNPPGVPGQLKITIED